MTKESTEAAITVEGLTKRYGELVAVHDLSFRVRRGSVTGFLGPNGAGKTIALKAIVGIARPTAGRALINGTPIESAHADARVLGVYIEPTGAHPGRVARNHLRSLAALAGLPRGRVDDVLAIVGLEDAADRRVGTFSAGMRQRLGLASALLGDPEVLVLDEPLNGLDPQGIRWLRTFLRDRAAAGGTVLLSSHVLTEAAQTVDDVETIKTKRGEVTFLHYGDSLHAQDTKRDGYGIEAQLEWQGDQYTTDESVTDDNGPSDGGSGKAVLRLREGTPVWLMMCYVNKKGRRVQCSGWQRATA